MTGLEPPPEEQRREFHKMGQIIEGTNNEAYAKLRETALQPETGVDASSLGQLRDAIKKVIPCDDGRQVSMSTMI